MSCRCPACNPMIRARPEREESCRLTSKERIIKQRKERYRESQETWAYVQANGSRYEEHRERIQTERKATSVEVNSPTIEEMLADPTLDSINPVSITPISMMVDDMGALITEGREFVKAPSLSGLASMAIIAIPGKFAENAFMIAKNGGKHSGFYKNNVSRTSEELKKVADKIQKKIDLHQSLIDDPSGVMNKLGKGNWDSLDPRQKKALVEKKWPSDINRQKEQQSILSGILLDRKLDNE